LEKSNVRKKEKKKRREEEKKKRRRKRRREEEKKRSVKTNMFSHNSINKHLEKKHH